jgi:cobalt/nickel transport system ATP-binding protein
MGQLLLKHISCIYDKICISLEDINLSVEKGETICVLGANGSWKSTLLQIIASCVKPSCGEIFIDGVLLKPGVSRTLAVKTLKNVAAEELAERQPYKLSGGEKQRVALASILIMNPEILLLDEPSADLDPRTRKNIITIFKNLHCTKIIASHDMDMALDIADRMLFLHKGKIAADCPAPGLLLDEVFLQSIGMELPLGVLTRKY